MLPEFMNKQARLVVRDVGVHRADDADVVDAARPFRGTSSLTSMPVWPCLRYLNGEGSILPSRRLQAVGFARIRARLAVVLVQVRLGVERVDVRRPAVHEQEDDALGPRREVRRLGRQRVAIVGQRWRGGEQAGVAQHAGQAHGAEPAADAGEDVAASDGALVAHDS